MHGDIDGDGVRSPREILRILYVDTLGRFWGDDFQPWADIRRNPNECELLGITCVNGQIARIDLSNAELCSNGIKNTLGSGPAAYCKGLPSEIGELTGLEVLQLTKRQFLRGTIPSQLGRLTLIRVCFYLLWPCFSGCTLRLKCVSFFLSMMTQMLDLTSTAMTGTLPSELGNLSNLKRLLLAHSQFGGTVPPEIFALKSLEKFHLTNNAFNGTLSSQMGNLKNVKELMVRVLVSEVMHVISVSKVGSISCLDSPMTDITKQILG